MHPTRPIARCLAALTLGATIAGCATGGTAAPAAAPQASTAAPQATWPVRTRYHVDLWLHGYAMLQQDTTLVPYFKRGYHDQLAALKKRANVFTQLDANREQLRRRLAANPGLVGGQFLPLYFGSWEDMQKGIDIFLRAEGDPRRASDQETQQMIATFAASFPSGADRDWLRLFEQGVADESQRFYQSYWNQQQRERSATLGAVDSLWTRVYLPKFQGFLNNTQQAGGELLLSLPLDGEGRTIANGGRSNLVAVTFPDAAASALDAVYVFAHEAMGTIANQAVSDNTTPAEKRTGVADRYTSAAAVRGGALLVQRVAPELLVGYERYYLRSANVAGSGDPAQMLARAFPLPQPILDGMRRQLDVVMGGI
ncbi:MAG TPA: hypothetical protein VFS44_04970 [Gemmatimonadaceae bacterium]|nr:hypothetical protein [Gemmatimonadaceae bacterium]